MSLEARFWDKVDATGDCWEWTGAKSYGYGRLHAPDLGTNASHRIAYEMLVGPIPDGFELDHLCRNRACVNPDHLEPVTRRENSLRSYSIPAQKARQTHCIRGHELTAANTHIRASTGARRCRTCLRASNNAWKQQRKEVYSNAGT